MTVLIHQIVAVVHAMVSDQSFLIAAAVIKIINTQPFSMVKIWNMAMFVLLTKGFMAYSTAPCSRPGFVFEPHSNLRSGRHPLCAASGRD